MRTIAEAGAEAAAPGEEGWLVVCLGTGGIAEMIHMLSPPAVLGLAPEIVVAARGPMTDGATGKFESCRGQNV